MRDQAKRRASNHRYDISLKGRFSKYKRTAARDGRTFRLTIKQFDLITSKPCEFCGNFNGEGEDSPYNGIDRKENSRGYTTDNALPCCWICNKAKGTMDAEDFIEHSKTIAAFQIRKAKREE
jgi:hypothetical protein